MTKTIGEKYWEIVDDLEAKGFPHAKSLKAARELLGLNRQKKPTLDECPACAPNMAIEDREMTWHCLLHGYLWNGVHNRNLTN
jgi:hypothetical protein